MKLNVNVAVNNLSFGWCSYNILKEIYNRKINSNIFLIGNNADLSSFDKVKSDFTQWLQNSVNGAITSYSRSTSCFKLWHIMGSENSYSNDQYLFTFHELNALTPTEVNILNNQKHIFVSSNYSKQVFELHGVTTPITFVPLGFDSENFVQTNNKYYSDDRIVWSIFGKLEFRKRHEKTIRAWLKKYGNNRNHYLHLHTYNNFLTPEQNTQLINNVFEGKRYFNVVLLPYTKTLKEYNECLNATNIVIDMSGGEAWSLPAFSCVGLGKNAIVHNCSAMKDWANNSNAVLVEPNSQIEVYDNIFFKKGQPISQGLIFDFKEEDFLDACDIVLERFKKDPINHAGLKIQNDFTWTKTVDIILDNIK